MPGVKDVLGLLNTLKDRLTVGRFNLKSLQKRTVSAVVMIPLVLLAVYTGGWLFYLMVFGLTVTSLYEWNMMAAKTEARGRHVGLGALYVLVGFVFCILIREYESLGAAVVFLLMVWAADIGAYFTGKAIGGPKMSPVISPNKTWAGLGGAAVFGGLIGVIYVFATAFLGTEPHIEIAPLISIFGIGLVIGLAGQAGDLIVSAMKRTAGVKDTGDLIPGHGGLLDRIDSMLLAAPVFYFLFSALGMSV